MLWSQNCEELALHKYLRTATFSVHGYVSLNIKLSLLFKDSVKFCYLNYVLISLLNKYKLFLFKSFRKLWWNVMLKMYIRYSGTRQWMAKKTPRVLLMDGSIHSFSFISFVIKCWEMTGVCRNFTKIPILFNYFSYENILWQDIVSFRVCLCTICVFLLILTYVFHCIRCSK